MDRKVNLVYVLGATQMAIMTNLMSYTSFTLEETCQLVRKIIEKGFDPLHMSRREFATLLADEFKFERLSRALDNLGFKFAVTMRNFSAASALYNKVIHDFRHGMNPIPGISPWTIEDYLQIVNV